jgi:hypothetical protein
MMRKTKRDTHKKLYRYLMRKTKCNTHKIVNVFDAK